MSEWYFGIEREDYDAMLKKAIKLDPSNTVYQRSYYIELDRNNENNKQAIIEYVHDLFYVKSLQSKSMLKIKGRSW